MNENMDLNELREIAQNAAALETEHGYTLPYIEAMRRMYGHLRASTVLALIDRVEAAESAVQRVREVMSEWDSDEDSKGLHFDLSRALDGGEQE